MKTKAPRSSKPRKRLHRSFTIDSELVAKALRMAPPELSGNLNRMVSVALAELVAKFERMRFEGDMAEMAADPALRGESARIGRDFRRTEIDGL